MAKKDTETRDLENTDDKERAIEAARLQIEKQFEGLADEDGRRNRHQRYQGHSQRLDHD
jgi:hypothetical protein